jgi:cytochrome c
MSQPELPTMRKTTQLKSLPILLAAAGLVAAPYARAGNELMDKAGCSACHRIDDKLVGPAYKDVAARYKSDPGAAARLFDKVRDGGSGAWGDTPMPPYDEDRISDADLKTLIGWVLQQQ